MTVSGRLFGCAAGAIAGMIRRLDQRARPGARCCAQAGREVDPACGRPLHAAYGVLLMGPGWPDRWAIRHSVGHGRCVRSRSGSWLVHFAMTAALMVGAVLTPEPPPGRAASSPCSAARVAQC